LSSIYHTDFPQYARFLGDDAFMESLVWSYMEWFYGQFHLVYVNSEFYRKRWMERGFREERLKILPRGLDTDLFDARHRDESFWKKRGTHGPVLLYVGRISKEKDLSLLPDVMGRLKKIGVNATLALVGEGPYRAELQQLLPEAVFTGVLTGRELGMAYASADLFVFPSTTDTFGNVVIEALASGLPVAVSDVGGPRELVKKSEQGRVLPARDAEAWAQALAEMLTRLPSREERQALSQAVHDQRSWNHAAEVFWSDGLI
jgi:glycosyltransferase involved in cell wall biosynthesis